MVKSSLESIVPNSKDTRILKRTGKHKSGRMWYSPLGEIDKAILILAGVYVHLNISFSSPFITCNYLMNFKRGNIAKEY